MRRLGVQCAVVLLRSGVPQLRLATGEWLEWDRTDRMWGPWDAERVVDSYGWRERLIAHATQKRERHTGLGSRTARAA